MNTSFLLMTQYNAQAIIPVEKAVEDCFPHLSTDKFLRKITSGEIKLPVTRMDPASQKGPKGVYLADLAQYIDLRREAANKEASQLAKAA
jgi:hypothetical protein